MNKVEQTNGSDAQNVISCGNQKFDQVEWI